MRKALWIQLLVGLLIGGGLGAAFGYFGRCSGGTCSVTASMYSSTFIGSLAGGGLAVFYATSPPSDEGD